MRTLLNRAYAPVLLLAMLGMTMFPGDQAALPAGVTPGRIIVADGEELLYEVSWTFVKLGTIRLRTFPNFTSRAEIDSYEGLPFVDLHSVHSSAMDTLFFSRSSSSLDKSDGQWKGLEYLYNPAEEQLVVEETIRKDPSSAPDSRRVRDTLRHVSRAFEDGLSIAYYPRARIHTVQEVDVPTILYGKLGITTFHFTNKKTTENIDAFPQPVRVIQVEGTTTAEGIYGMTGDLTGWFSDDSAAVPIKGKLKVLIGNVTLELIQWKRAGWTPPH